MSDPKSTGKRPDKIKTDRDPVKPAGIRKPSHSKGYYSFQKQYPGAVGESDYFPVQNRRHLSLREKLLTAAAAVLVFLLFFLTASVGMNLSEKTPRAVTAGTGITEEAVPERAPGITRSAEG